LQHSLSHTQRTKAAAAAASKPKPRKRRNNPKDFRNWTRQQLEADLTPEQQRWRSALTAFLGRPIDLPLLAPGAPVLDLQKLFIEVRVLSKHFGILKLWKSGGLSETQPHS
jgi:hypothetical protein